jgi:two-component system, response regulator YesN
MGMMKVLITDDEVQIRKGLRLKVDWEEEGFQIVAEASNGKDALEIIQNNVIDLVITDVRMPIMDGIELAEHCHRDFPHVKVIVLSGYSDFEYARNSLKQGVKDYLLKPVAPEELIESLRKVRHEIEEESKKQNKIAQMNRLVHSHLQELQEQYILHLCKEERLQLPIVKERLLQLQLGELANENLRVQFVTVEIREDYDLSRLKELRTSFQLVCKEISLEEKGIYSFIDTSYANMVHFLRLIDSDSPSVNQLVNKIQQNIKSFLKFETVIGIGTVVSGLPEFRAGYISSLLAWSQSKMGSKSQVIDSSFTSEEDIDFSPDFEKRLINSIENVDFVSFRDNLQTLLGGIDNRSIFSFSIAANQVLFLLGSLAKKYDVETKDIQNTIWNCQQSIWNLTSQHKVNEYLIQLAQLIIEKIRTARFSNKKLIDSIRHYLDQHYASEISLTTLSNLFHINSAHLSETFKNHVGQNFSDYLVNLRMVKAKQLLQDKQLKIIDVANLVGFSNSGYFSTVFKKHFGQTPVEFRHSFDL